MIYQQKCSAFLIGIYGHRGILRCLLITMGHAFCLPIDLLTDLNALVRIAKVEGVLSYETLLVLLTRITHSFLVGKLLLSTLPFFAL